MVSLVYVCCLSECIVKGRGSVEEVERVALHAGLPSPHGWNRLVDVRGLRIGQVS